MAPSLLPAMAPVTCTRTACSMVPGDQVGYLVPGMEQHALHVGGHPEFDSQSFGTPTLLWPCGDIVAVPVLCPPQPDHKAKGDAHPEEHCVPRCSATRRRRLRRARARMALYMPTGPTPMSPAPAAPETSPSVQVCSGQSSLEKLPTVPEEEQAQLPVSDDLPPVNNLIESAELSSKIIEELDCNSRARISLLLGWLRPAALELALSARGCRVVQKALEVAGG